MWRFVALFLVILVLAPGTWLREKLPPRDDRELLHIRALERPAKVDSARLLGAFALDGVWQLTSPNSRFGGYSALVALGGGELLAIGDRGYLMRFAAPGAAERQVRIAPIRPAQVAARYGYDAEAAAYDAQAGRVWIAWESGNRITRHGLDFGGSAMARPAAMRDWGVNSGPEAMARLADGRFVVLREGFEGWFGDERHRALVFRGDPITGERPLRFTFIGPAGFSPTDMAQLPDGRVLILMRRLLWPIPARFEGRIAIADPRAIRAGGVWRARTVARLSSPLPVDNFEGLAIEPRDDGRVTVWVISDANGAVTQRTLLWKLAVDPAELTSKRARGRPARPFANQKWLGLRRPASWPARASPSARAAKAWCPKS